MTYLREMLQHIWERIPAWLRNKYLLTGAAFVVWMAFFDQNDMISQVEMRMELRQLEEDRSYYEEEITDTRDELEELLTDDQKLERFARERYLMKKDNEVVFVIVPEEE